MAIARWLGTAKTNVQSGTVIVAGYHSGDTYKLVMTDEAGKTFDIASTIGTTNASVTAGLLADQWNDSNNAKAQQVTASVSTATITLTADTAGVPFQIQITISGGSGGSVTAYAAATDGENSGPNDYGTAENWDTGAVPTSSDSVIIPSGTNSILYSLNQSAITIMGFRVEEGYSGSIGGTDNGYLKIVLDTADEVYFAGTGQAWIDVGASPISDPIIENTYSPGSGEYGLSLKGSLISCIYLRKGHLGYGIQDDDTTTEVDSIFISFIDDPANDSTLVLGKGVTDTGGGGDPDVKMNGGKCYAWCDVDVLVVENQGDYQQLKGKWATCTCVNGTVRPDNYNASQTYGTTLLANSAKLIKQNKVACTFGVVTVKSNDVTIDDDNGAISWNGTTSIDWDNCKIDGCTINPGFNKKIVITSS